MTYFPSISCTCTFGTDLKNRQGDTLLGTKISHLRKRKIILPATFEGEILVFWRVRAGNPSKNWSKFLVIYRYIYIYIYTQHGWAFGNLAGNFTDWDSLTYWYLIYIVYKYLEPKWPLSLKVNTPKTRPFAIKTRVIWVLGIYTYIYITFTYSLHAVPTFCDKTLLFKARFEEIFERWHQKKVCNAKANNLSKKNDKMLPRTARI